MNRSRTQAANLCSNCLAMRLSLSKLTLAAISLGIGIACAKAGPGPSLSIKGLVDPADLIIAGKVERVEQTGTGSMELNGVDYTRLDFQAEMRVDETIKGGPAPLSFTFSYSTRAVDSVGNVAEGSLAPNTYRVVFLKKTATSYAFVSPYFPSIPAASRSCGPNWQIELGEDTYHKVLQRVLSVLCTTSSAEEKRAALWTLSWDEESSAAPFLRAALNLPNVKSDPTLRMSIVSDLLHWKDLSVLPLAETDLFDQSVRSPFYPKSNLVLAVSRLEPQISIPLLARVLKLPEPEERVAAARFLEYTNSQTALDILLSALDDPDREVQFAVMQSLGNLTNQHWWRPRTLDPDSHWSVSIEHWREFGAQRNTHQQ
jgi:HEAT repeats